MVATMAGAIRVLTLLASSGPPAAQIFKSATDMYGYYNTTNNTNLSGLERIHNAISQVHKYRFCPVTYTAREISFMYYFSGNSAASAPISKFMCLRAIYIVLGLVYIFPPVE
jgi:hypothetical protein